MKTSVPLMAYAKQNNNFDLLRFLLAVTVFLVHSYVLSGSLFLEPISKILSSEVAVQSFFIVSGFLIFMSYENSKTAKSYFQKRFWRIFPAYFFVIIVTVLIASLFTAYTLDHHWWVSVLKYFLANLFFLNFINPNLPGVFEANLNPTINGALWTLKIEVMFYLAVPLFVSLFNKVGRLPGMLCLFVCSVIYSYVLLAIDDHGGGESFLALRRQLPGQLTYFIVGAAGYYYFEYFKRFSKPIFLLAIMVILFRAYLPWVVFEPIALGVLVLYFATIFPYIGNFGKYGDFSYGIYILHFPVLQIFISHQLFDQSPLLALITSSSIVLLFAVLLWNFVEKPFLRHSSHYVSG